MDGYAQLQLACETQMHGNWPAPFLLPQESGSALWAMNQHGSTFFIEQLGQDQGNLQAGDYLVRWMPANQRQLRPAVPTRSSKFYGEPDQLLIHGLHEAKPLPTSWAWGVTDRRKILELLLIIPQPITAATHEVTILPLVARERAERNFLAGLMNGIFKLDRFWSAVQNGYFVNLNHLFSGKQMTLGRLSAVTRAAYIDGIMYAPSEAWYVDDVRHQHLRHRQIMMF